MTSQIKNIKRNVPPIPATPTPETVAIIARVEHRMNMNVKIGDVDDQVLILNK